MPDRETGGGGAGLPLAAVALAAVVAGVFALGEPPLPSARPSPLAEPPEPPERTETVRARLWEDPLAALRRAPGRGEPPDEPPRCRAVEAGSRGDGPFCLGVLLFDSPYVAAAESRRTTRYAVVSALGALGFSPEKAGHLDRYEGEEGRVVPYESFHREDGAEVALLWLSESLVRARPLHDLKTLAEELGVAPLRIVGPTNSDLLVAMLDEARCSPERECPEPPSKEPRIELYSHSATAPASELRESGTRADLRTQLRERDVRLHRTIPTDDVLARHLVLELRRRRVRLDGEGAIALVGEWDTSYGRSLLRIFHGKLDELPGRAGCEECVRRYSYLRGIDGKGPERRPDPVSAAPPEEGGAAGEQGEDPGPKRPFGRGQEDYLRRLARRIERGSDGGPRAIGVLGTDLYDKLQVIRALRYRFPDAILFTTDLDANLFHPEELEWTRNLVVVSGFGLELHEDLQGEVPPFRTVYQTSTFLSAQLALRELRSGPSRSLLESWVPAGSSPLATACPRTFEIGRDGPVPLTPPGWVAWHGAEADDGQGASCSRRCAPAPRSGLLLEAWSDRLARRLARAHEGGSGVAPSWSCECAQGLHPPARRPGAPGGPFLAGGLLVVLVGLLLLVYSDAFRVRAGHLARALRARPRLSAGVALVLVLLVAGGILVALEPTGEPMSLWKGVSVWPTQAIRLLAGLVALGTLFEVLYSLRRNAEDLDRDFFGEDREALALPSVRAELDELRERLRRARGAAAKWRAVRDRLLIPTLDERRIFSREPVDARAAWWENQRLSGWLPSASRIGLLALLYFGVAVVMVRLVLHRPPPPTRGYLIAPLHEFVLIGCAVIPLVFLLITVLDRTKLCVHLVRELSRGTTVWPKATADALYEGHAEQTERLSEWLDIELIARRTGAVSRLVYFPFLVVFLLVVSRWNALDAWSFPLGVGLAVAVSLLYVLSSGVVLRRAAESARDRALTRMGQRLLSLRASAKEAQRGEAEQLASAIEQVRGLREGAFAPFRQQPVLRTGLLVVTGVGWLVLEQLGLGGL